jgi:hypothetical protein
MGSDRPLQVAIRNRVADHRPGFGFIDSSAGAKTPEFYRKHGSSSATFYA